MPNVEVVQIVRKKRLGKFEVIKVGLRPVSEGLMIREYELVYARNKAGEDVQLTEVELIEAETEADLIWWGVA